MPRLEDYQTITDCRPIICSGQVPYREAVQLFRRLYESYPPTDKRLLDYAADRAPTSLPMVLRVLAQVSTGERLITPLLSIYYNSRDRRVVAQAAMLLARIHRDHTWVAEALRHAEPRVRANVVEGLRGWNHNLEVSRRATGDPNHRVAVNACLNLIHAGDERGRVMLESFLKDRRPDFRVAACWGLGTIAGPTDIPTLTALLSDEHPGVRAHASRALRRLREAA